MKTLSILSVALIMAGMAFAAAPVVTISLAGQTTYVDNTVATYTFTVTNNTEVVGGVRLYNGNWYNWTYAAVATTRWQTVTLVPGMNDIVIIGTNDWATGTVSMVACTNKTWIRRDPNPANYPGQDSACQTGTVSQWTWLKVSIGNLVDGTIDTNADVIIPFAANEIEISPLAGDTASILSVATTTNQNYIGAGIGPGNAMTMINVPVHPYVANYLMPFTCDHFVNTVWIKADATNRSYQIKARRK